MWGREKRPPRVPQDCATSRKEEGVLLTCSLCWLLDDEESPREPSTELPKPPNDLKLLFESNSSLQQYLEHKTTVELQDIQGL